MMLVSLIFLGSFFLLPFLETHTGLSKAAGKNGKSPLKVGLIRALKAHSHRVVLTILFEEYAHVKLGINPQIFTVKRTNIVETTTLFLSFSQSND